MYDETVSSQSCYKRSLDDYLNEEMSQYSHDARLKGGSATQKLPFFLVSIASAGAVTKTLTATRTAMTTARAIATRVASGRRRRIVLFMSRS